MLEKRHYEEIAIIIAKLRRDHHRSYTYLSQDIAAEFARRNPKFKTTMFHVAVSRELDKIDREKK